MVFHHTEKRGSFERLEIESDCNLTWEEARHECRQLDDDLITLSSEAQYQHVMELLDPEASEKVQLALLEQSR